MVDLCESNVNLCDKVNRLGAENLAKVSDEYNCKLIHISTDYVLMALQTPTKEDACKSIVCLRQIKSWSRKSRFICCPNSIVIRTAWLYSSFKLTL